MHLNEIYFIKEHFILNFVFLDENKKFLSKMDLCLTPEEFKNFCIKANLVVDKYEKEYEKIKI